MIRAIEAGTIRNVTIPYGHAAEIHDAGPLLCRTKRQDALQPGCEPQVQQIPILGPDPGRRVRRAPEAFATRRTISHQPCRAESACKPSPTQNSPARAMASVTLAMRGVGAATDG